VARRAALTPRLAERVRALVRRSSGIDWAAEGLLDGVRGERDRADRIALLEDLARAGVEVDTLRRAVAEDHLALLPVERVLAGAERHTLTDLAAAADLPVDRVAAGLAAFGMPVPAPDAVAFDDEDLALARSMGTFAAAGLDEDGRLEVAHVLGLSAAQSAGAIQALITASLLRPGASERDLGLSVAALAEALGPELERLFGHLLRVHLREAARSAVVGAAERRFGRLPDTTDTTVAFADLVGFTALGERAPARELGHVAARLAAAAGAAARPPVRVVKLVGDGVMLACPRPEPLLAALLELLAADGLPPLRAGVARGPVVSRRGDLFGAPVNLASRLCAAAEPGQALADERVRDALRAGAGAALAPAGRRALRGVERPVGVFAVVPEAGGRG